MIRRAPISTMRPEITDISRKVDQLMDTVGDGTGDAEMATSAAVYKCVPSPDRIYVLSRMNVYIEDNTKFRGDRYGASASLVNGIDITIHDGSGSLFRYTPYPIRKIGHWHLLAGVDMFFTDFPIGNDIAAVRWSFWKGSGYMVLNGDKGEFLQVEVRDDISDLVSHIAQVQGVQRGI